MHAEAPRGGYDSTCRYNDIITIKLYNNDNNTII